MNMMAGPTLTGPLPESRRTVTVPPSHHNRDLALQKYLVLHEQHESLRQHLDELRPLQTAFGSTTITTSPVASPTRTSSTSSFSSYSLTSPYRSLSGAPTMSQPSRRASLPSRVTCIGLRSGSELAAVPDETTLAEVAVGEAKLCDVNEGIKRTLTELLNCEAVRGDRAFRTWVQCRLMDTERELRSGRRRRSAPEP
ncbi:hypothetical protein B0T25DRAFT_447299 [Lasiosphaeria hispida]|uniref:Uncharacterized protein n=1 Tax=Lasiosphaeria hispida TaxID=260671 RepID=A0AAJ0HP18_9PEZI|nr:hypothetical protein B0T25DRAFT_447299 [Lasiosphaeria hispida]